VFTLALTPSGRLITVETSESTGEDVPASVVTGIHAAFAKELAEGLLHLATVRLDAALPPVFSYWRAFGERYLTALCHVPETAERVQESLPPPDEELPAMVQAAPPFRGGEYLRIATLQQFWSELDECARGEIGRSPGGLSQWLHARSPLWHRVGRVCFHLAENKRDPDCPFAFLATYAPKLLDGRRVQYQPLGKALEEYAGAQKKQTLVNLLAPVERASRRCAWVKELVDSGEVFHPLRWAPGEAYRFLKDAPALEESGLLVRMPDWWSKTPPRVRVGVSIGQKRQSRFGVDTMLDFQVGLALEGETLSEEEWERILASSDGLVFLKGRWVEVDREKLSKVLQQWEQVEQEAGADGVSFLQGMRLLAGAPLDAGAAGLFEADTASWSEVRAGDWLEGRLRELRQPQNLAVTLPCGDLRATLRPYQETGVKWLWFLARLGLGACLADDMGLGKTIQVISLLLWLKRETALWPVTDRGTQRTAGLANDGGPARSGTPAGPALLVLPASLLANWKSEIERFAPSLVVRFTHPSQVAAADLKRAAADPQEFLHGADVVITTYSMLARLPWLSSVRWRLVALDEAQAVKNPAARQTRSVKQLQAAAKIVLTGTPVENRLTDLWSIFDFLCPGLLGSVKAFGEFVKRLEKREQADYAPLRKLVAPYILRRLKTDRSIIADLPEKTEMQAFCRLTKKQAALYEQAVRELARLLKQKQGIERRGTILAFLLRLKQICNHPAQWLAAGDYPPEDSGKFRRLGELCEEIAERQEKALVFTQFREMTGPLEAWLRTVFGRPGLVLHGQIAVGKRQPLVDAFQRDDGPPFFVLSLKAGGTGLNLTAASHVIHFDRWWNPAVENQATDRAFRIGQKKNVVVHKFVCQGTIEEKIDVMIRDKKALAEEILEAGVPKLITELGDRELLNLVKLDVSTIGEE
jgi:non-specific serine/threonine protein kinase